jgi:GNAT superfamily N-acetyltransferase
VSLSSEPPVAALIAERGRAAGVVVEQRAVGTTTLLTCDALPHDVGWNRAFDVDAREPGTAAAIVEHARGTGRRSMLEIDTDSLGPAERATLTRLGLSMRWELYALRLGLASFDLAAPTGVTVRAVRPDEADAFSTLAVRAYGAPMANFPLPDPAVELRKWAAFPRLGHASCFFAEVDGTPAAIGMSLRVSSVALVDGAATVPEHRGRGCHAALLVHRFREARAEGARVAVTRTASRQSQRNLERAGMVVFRRMEVWGDDGGA